MLGKAKWLKLKREVAKDAKKIFIIAPIPRKYTKKEVEIVKGEEQEKTKVIEYNSYRYVYVYDISQTEGKPIPMQENRIDSNNMGYFYNKLKSFSKVQILEENLEGPTEGYYSPNKNQVVIKKSLSIDDKVSVLLHELSHAIYDDFDYSKDRNLSEIFVESIAYIVADYFGLDTSKCSFNYITKWAKGEPKLVIELGNKIQKCANEFIKEIEEFEMQSEKMVA